MLLKTSETRVQSSDVKTKYKANESLNLGKQRASCEIKIRIKLRQLNAVPVAIRAGGFSRKHFSREKPPYLQAYQRVVGESEAHTSVPIAM